MDACVHLTQIKLASGAPACDSPCAIVLQAVSCSDHAGLLASVAKVIADHGFNIQVAAQLLVLLSVGYSHTMLHLVAAAADRSLAADRSFAVPCSLILEPLAAVTISLR